MPERTAKPSADLFGSRELLWNERVNGTREKMHIGENTRLVVYSSYASEANNLIRFYYSFSDNLRGTVVPYGSPKVTFRWLYALLSKKFSVGHNSFLDAYFSREIYIRMVSEIRELVLSQTQRRDERGRFITFAQQKLALDKFQVLCRRDCIEWLRSGGVHYRLAASTIKKREALGIVSKAAFFATGQLINDIQITVVMDTVGD